MKLKILLAEDHELTRQGIAFGLRRYDNMQIVAEAENGQQAVDYAVKFNPDIILMDIVMPVLSGIKATRQVKQFNPAVKVIMLTSHNEREKVLSAFSAGADAYCMKNIKIEKLVQIIEMVSEGAVWLDSSVSSYLLELCPASLAEIQASSGIYSDDNRDFNLTAREKDILKLMSEGMSNKDISQSLSLSLYTVKNHVSSIIQKLAVDDRTQAALMAVKNHLI